MTQPGKLIRFFRTTAIGGLLFLLPLIVLGALIGQVVPVVLTIAATLGKFLPGFIKTPGGITLLVLLSIVILWLLCFCAGILAQWSWGQKFSEVFEKNLLLLFPRYAILKDQMAGTLGGTRTKPKMKPVVVQFDDCLRLGFETERNDQAELVSVYLPGSPDPWSGYVALVTFERVAPVPASFSSAVTTCEQLGRGTKTLMQKPSRANST